MNSRQRVLNAIKHIEPEGLPVDLGATPSSGISAIAYDNLLHHIPLDQVFGQNYLAPVLQYQ